MRNKTTILIFMVFALLSCKREPKPPEGHLTRTEDGLLSYYLPIGGEITAKDALTSGQMNIYYEGMAIGDTIQVKFKAAVNSVCKEKGCWMVLDLANGEEVMVKFKEYAFFVPKDIENSEVVVNGKAYVTEVSVEEQRHYAKDGGQSPEEIAAITQPKKTFSFLADGVLIER